MFKKFLAIWLLWFSTQGLYAQIKFEKGYFIDNNGIKTECLIRNVDWKNNPVKFDYKLSFDGEIFSQFLENTSEFNIENASKYIKRKININRSSDKAGELDRSRTIEFHEETLFLKAIVEGTANLYYYEDGNLRRFFFNINGDDIIQLEYKKYLSSFDGYQQGIKQSGFKIRENNSFRQQLHNNLICEGISEKNIKNISYKIDPLRKFFNDFNRCMNPNYIAKKENSNKFSVNTKIRFGVGITSLNMESSAYSFRTTDFESQNGFRAGLEIEVFLPFNNNKWAFVVEPTYQQFSKETAWEQQYNFNDYVSNYSKSVEYSSIETPVGIRHYMFINKKSKIFLSSSVILDFTFNSKITYQSFNTTSDEIGFNSGLAFGIGYDYNSKLNLELKYLANREILSNSADINSKTEFGGISLLFGYKIF